MDSGFKRRRIDIGRGMGCAYVITRLTDKGRKELDGASMASFLDGNYIFLLPSKFFSPLLPNPKQAVIFWWSSRTSSNLSWCAVKSNQSISSQSISQVSRVSKLTCNEVEAEVEVCIQTHRAGSAARPYSMLRPDMQPRDFKLRHALWSVRIWQSFLFNTFLSSALN